MSTRTTTRCNSPHRPRRGPTPARPPSPPHRQSQLVLEHLPYRAWRSSSPPWRAGVADPPRLRRREQRATLITDVTVDGAELFLQFERNNAPPRRSAPSCSPAPAGATTGSPPRAPLDPEPASSGCWLDADGGLRGVRRDSTEGWWGDGRQTPLRRRRTFQLARGVGRSVWADPCRPGKARPSLRFISRSSTDCAGHRGRRVFPQAPSSRGMGAPVVLPSAIGSR